MEVEESHRGGAVEDESLQSRAAYLRGVADTLRGIASGLQYDFRRADQLRSLADGFERFAARLEHEAVTRHGKTWPPD